MERQEASHGMNVNYVLTLTCLFHPISLSLSLSLSLCLPALNETSSLLRNILALFHHLHFYWTFTQFSSFFILSLSPCFPRSFVLPLNLFFVYSAKPHPPLKNYLTFSIFSCLCLLSLSLISVSLTSMDSLFTMKFDVFYFFVNF